MYLAFLGTSHAFRSEFAGLGENHIFGNEFAGLLETNFSQCLCWCFGEKTICVAKNLLFWGESHFRSLNLLFFLKTISLQ